MGRAHRSFQVTVPPETIFQEIQQYLTAEGYAVESHTITKAENEYLFKKGNGFLKGPSFIKVSGMNNPGPWEAIVRHLMYPNRPHPMGYPMDEDSDRMSYPLDIEAWIKVAILPFVFVGKIDPESFAGAVVKSPLKNHFAHIQDIIRKYELPRRPYILDYVLPLTEQQQRELEEKDRQRRQIEATQSQIICPECGFSCPSRAFFCAECGALLKPRTDSGRFSAH